MPVIHQTQNSFILSLWWSIISWLPAWWSNSPTFVLSVSIHDFKRSQKLSVYVTDSTRTTKQFVFISKHSVRTCSRHQPWGQRQTAVFHPVMRSLFLISRNLCRVGLCGKKAYYLLSNPGTFSEVCTLCGQLGRGGRGQPPWLFSRKTGRESNVVPLLKCRDCLWGYKLSARFGLTIEITNMGNSKESSYR